MPIIWGLVVGVFIYFVLQEMGKKHSLKSEKPTQVTLPTGDVDAVAPSAETELPPAVSPAVAEDAGVPSVETESLPETESPPETGASPATLPAEEVVTEAPSVESEPPREDKAARPPFIDTIPGLTREIKQELQRLKLTTVKSISGASDKKLLAVKGIGAARLKQIRSLCAEAKK